MIRVTHKEHHEHIGLGQSEIILSGPPSSLQGPVTFHNSASEKLFIRELPMKNVRNEDASFPVHTTLQPKEIKSKNVHYSIDPLTPPGTYHASLRIGKAVKKITLIVHENLEILLSPSSLVLEGIGPGLIHTKEILFTNKGNIALTIPAIKHNTLTDMDLVCRNLSQAVRSNGNEGIEKTLDAFTKGLKKDITDWVDISIKEAGEAVEPGQTILLHISIALPKDINKNYHYTGDIRMFDQVIRYTAVSKTTAAPIA
jgi:hypothetical protein